jgi:hypothetical protein
MTSEQKAEMRKRADVWLNDHVSGKRITRDNALGEEQMALDVCELLDALEAAQAENERLRNRQFRVMGAGSVPWRLVAPYEEQAKDNHDQSLERLNERGGLDPRELWCVVHGKRLREMPTAEVALSWLSEWRQHDIVAKLAAVTAARDELADKLDYVIARYPVEGVPERVGQLRAVGKAQQ